MAEIENTKPLFQYLCRFCKYAWNGRLPHEPVQCPHCKRYNWK